MLELSGRPTSMTKKRKLKNIGLHYSKLVGWGCGQNAVMQTEMLLTIISSQNVTSTVVVQQFKWYESPNDG